MRDGLSRGLIETFLAIAGLFLVIGDSVLPKLVHNGFNGGIALVGLSATSYGLRYTRPSGTPDRKDPE